MTTQNTHTPGPWTASGCAIVSNLAANFHHDYQTQVATIGTRCACEDGTELVAMQRGEVDANARLIAASPDLLTACESALALLTNPNADPSDADAVTAMLKTAITKAKGAT